MGGLVQNTFSLGSEGRVLTGEVEFHFLKLFLIGFKLGLRQGGLIVSKTAADRPMLLVARILSGAVRISGRCMLWRLSVGRTWLGVNGVPPFGLEGALTLIHAVRGETRTRTSLSASAQVGGLSHVFVDKLLLFDRFQGQGA